MKTKQFYLNAWFPRLAGGDGDGSGSGGGAGDAGGNANGGAGGAGGGAGGSGGTKNLTQDEVNAIIAKETAKFKATQQKYDDEIKALKARADLTAKERQELDERIGRLQSEHMTKAEQMQAEIERQRKEAQAQLKKTEAEALHFKERFTQKMIVSDVTQAAVIHKAVHPGQIMALVGPMTSLVEELDADGKPTGQYVTQVKYPTTDKDGKPIVLTMTVDAAVKRMREEQIHANLFQFDGKSGTGGGNAGSGQKLNMSEILRDPVKYREAREKGLID